MDTEFLFSSFPFISEEAIMLSQMYISDEERLDEILKTNEVDHSAQAHLNMAEHNFKHNRSVELGYYRKDKPNFLLGSINIGGIDNKINGVDLEITPSFEDIEAAELAIIAVTEFLFHHIKVSKITCKKIDASALWQGIMINAGLILEGCIRKAVLSPGKDKPSDVHIFGIIQEDLHKNKTNMSEDDYDVDNSNEKTEISSAELSIEPTLGEPTLGEPTLGEPTLGEPTSNKPVSVEYDLDLSLENTEVEDVSVPVELKNEDTIR